MRQLEDPFSPGVDAHDVGPVFHEHFAGVQDPLACRQMQRRVASVVQRIRVDFGFEQAPHDVAVVEARGRAAAREMERVVGDWDAFDVVLLVGSLSDSFQGDWLHHVDEVQSGKVRALAERHGIDGVVQRGPAHLV